MFLCCKFATYNDTVTPVVVVAGYHVVFMNPRNNLVTNAHMASTPGHPVWPVVMHMLLETAAAGEQHPMYATGPHIITKSLRVRVGWSNNTTT